jgi:hypothetical protein
MARVTQFGRHPNHLPAVIRKKILHRNLTALEKGRNEVNTTYSTRPDHPTEANGRVTIKKFPAFHKTGDSLPTSFSNPTG